MGFRFKFNALRIYCHGASQVDNSKQGLEVKLACLALTSIRAVITGGSVKRKHKMGQKLQNLGVERFSCDLEMMACKHNQNNKRIGRKLFDWFNEWRQILVGSANNQSKENGLRAKK